MDNRPTRSKHNPNGPWLRRSGSARRALGQRMGHLPLWSRGRPAVHGRSRVCDLLRTRECRPQKRADDVRSEQVSAARPVGPWQLESVVGQELSSSSGVTGDETVDTPVSYTHLRAHETDSYLVCRLL